jgi:isoleucyl-tRNA synthetase
MVTCVLCVTVGCALEYQGDKVVKLGQRINKARAMDLSVFLPKTSLPMKGRLVEQEGHWLHRWQKIDLYKKWRTLRKGAPLFVMHDGPPYANGPIHLGHGLNKILKDFTSRCRFMTGYDVSFVPGWDCHGLPIETQIEKEYLQRKVQRSQVDVLEFRNDCRQFAEKWIGVQKEGFQRLGVVADWANPYTTMDPVFESRILHHFYRMVEKGYIYRGLRPVLWSPAEQTALAESEVEYQDITSPSIYVRFPLVSAPSGWEGASVVIWTTTPWSLPGNRAVAYAPDAAYGCYSVTAVQPESLAQVGEKLIVASDLWPAVCQAAGITESQTLGTYLGRNLAAYGAQHPWNTIGYTHSVPLLPSEYVTTETGTGLVHTAPGHGVEDFEIGKRHGLEVASPLDEKGCFKHDVPLLAGLDMRTSYPIIRSALIQHGALLAESAYTHSYPHSWRSKKPLFYRATSQWFIALDGPLALRTKALAALPMVEWHPAGAETRMQTMLANRPDWCISRQRVWGVPIAMFLHHETGEVLQDQRVFQAITERVAKEGVDFWFTPTAHQVLDGLYDPAHWVKNHDIIDVWFESGVTHEVVLKDGVPGTAIGSVAWPASVYFEGSDQHRAWFQSSLAIAMALEDQAPYRAVVTHGFCLDQQGRKMSKSLGNVVSPSDVINRHGADILRLWVGYEDYQKDVRMGPAILDRVTDMYRRFRNTLRFSVGALADFSPGEYQEVNDMALLERWVHHRLYQLDQEIHAAITAYDFQTIVKSVYEFCNQDLSAFYFHICKDVLYCDGVDSRLRQQIRTTFLHIFVYVAHWLAPFISFTAEEAWVHFAQDILGLSSDDLDGLSSENMNTPLIKALAQWGLIETRDVWSIHLNKMPRAPAAWFQPEDDAEVVRLRTLRAVVTGVLERAREEKKIGDNLQSAVSLVLGPSWNDLSLESFSMWCVTSDIGVTRLVQSFSQENPGPIAQMDDLYIAGNDIALKVMPASGEKCQRCWRVRHDVAVHRGLESAGLMGMGFPEEAVMQGALATEAMLCPRCWVVVDGRLSPSV